MANNIKRISILAAAAAGFVSTHSAKADQNGMSYVYTDSAGVSHTHILSQNDIRNSNTQRSMAESNFIGAHVTPTLGNTLQEGSVEWIIPPDDLRVCKTNPQGTFGSIGMSAGVKIPVAPGINKTYVAGMYDEVVCSIGANGQSTGTEQHSLTIVFGNSSISVSTYGLPTPAAGDTIISHFAIQKQNITVDVTDKTIGASFESGAIIPKNENVTTGLIGAVAYSVLPPAPGQTLLPSFDNISLSTPNGLKNCHVYGSCSYATIVLKNNPQYPVGFLVSPDKFGLMTSKLTP